MIRTVIPIVLAAGAALAAGAQLQIGKDIVTRNDALRATLKLKEALRGAGRLKLTWTDCYGRSPSWKRTCRSPATRCPSSCP